MCSRFSARMTPIRANADAKNCIQIESFDTTDNQRDIGQRHRRGPRGVLLHGSTRLLLEFRSRKRFPNLASFRQVDAGSELAFSKKDETFKESQGILSPFRLPVPARPPY